MPASKLVNYASERGALAYRADYQNKLHRKVSDAIERRLFERLFAELGPVASVLDVPCGAGRLQSLLRQNSRFLIEADWSPSMLAVNRTDHVDSTVPYLRCTALALPLRDRAVDLVVSVRLSHHLEQLADRERHLLELFRVARRGVICTWFSATSVKNLLRRLRAPFDRKKPKNVLHVNQVKTLAAQAGFQTVRCLPLSRLSSGHVFGLFMRR
jgi:ubiquinone/menaquinone biosynthesis C-methylase UbiE